ncbi:MULTISPECIES: RNA polymerase sigma-54 factor [Acidobacterium]|uniref:RNA polymerase sigma-54 factor n=1 Tax=Acidobacterium capsulatum (strain ATCC 51196 / DSM 11244 / BCRC 80197 / JCM 7670 / NBRC 15755 / NCIMB 13165 / 161) TaxID=240015 RepID=C1F1M0_ACIC5|nr:MULTISPECIES: RNA polymerase sigma-54 factor [Acidobacterium]ACO33800.1 RNA polymerase sigma-54 factor [Acidobacterium capsulatum ATCC 51196]HCT61359.1 RNA polymerase sigma-54 factor [Acidobacterium sp.]
MALLQPKLNLKVAQRQILTPGLMQMVSVLALNKLELKEMIQAEIAENPVLEEMEESVPLLDDVARREEDHDRGLEIKASSEESEKKDPFDEIDFGSYFQDYLDPGFRTPNSFELTEKPSIENFLSAPSTLSDHLLWQLGALTLTPAIRDAAEYLIGNLNEDGYLPADEEDLLEGYLREQLAPEGAESVNGHAPSALTALPPAMAERARAHLASALEVVRQLDPIGIATRDLRECLMVQVAAQRREFDLIYQRTAVVSAFDEQAEDSAPAESTAQPESSAPGDPERLQRISVFETAAAILDRHMLLLQKRDPRELSKAVARSVEETQRAIDFIRTLDPRPGQRYNRSEARLIEPDVAFVKRDDEYVVVMNDEDLPSLRLNHGYRRLLNKDGAEKDVKDYVKERYRSALQLMRNIEQRKNTILKTCESIIRRQTDFLENGIEAMKPMMIKEVAEEIGVHPSTVSRAVSNKYVHTPQGVYELRFFFSEGVNGPEGSGTPLMLLKRKVKKLIEDEDPSKPLTDDQIAQMLQSQGIEVTRRTVAKYREDMKIPSTHQRRVRI